jgi:hypothetical protein
MRSTIEQRLSVLIGLPWWDAQRVGSVWESFHFGERRLLEDRKRGGIREVGSYALHIQCSWRIVSQQEVLVGWHDKFYPKGANPFDEPPDFDWDRVGVNRCDQRVEELLDLFTANPLTVESVASDIFGDIQIIFTNRYRLQTFHDDTLGYERELWRVFRPGDDSSHFVVTSGGIDNEDDDEEKVENR